MQQHEIRVDCKLCRINPCPFDMRMITSTWFSNVDDIIVDGRCFIPDLIANANDVNGVYCSLNGHGNARLTFSAGARAAQSKLSVAG